MFHDVISDWPEDLCNHATFHFSSIF